MTKEDMINYADSLKNCIDFKDRPIINIVKKEIFGFDTCYFSPTDEKLNKEIFKEGNMYESYEKIGVTIGYVIHNISNDTIENIVIPEYDLKTSPYTGKHKTVSLGPNEYMRIPTKYLVLLLMRLGNGLKLANGELVKIKKDLQTNDYDIKMSNYRFVPDNYWNDFFNMNNILNWVEPVGYFVIRNKNVSYEILQDYFIKLYGFIANIVKDGFKEDVEETKDEKVLESATFWASIFK